MTEAQFKQLKEGDLVRHKGRGDAFRIIYIAYTAFGNTIPMAVRLQPITNPSEWDHVDEAGEVKGAA